MNTSELIYEGDLRTLATHPFSGYTLTTDAPLDNHGKAQSFSPTDLVATALASCMITTMAILLKNEHIAFEGSRLEVRKIMQSQPRKIQQITIDFWVKGKGLTTEQKSNIERIAHNCPVALSLHPDIIQDVRFYYEN
jgi:putative redox protein